MLDGNFLKPFSVVLNLCPDPEVRFVVAKRRARSVQMLEDVTSQNIATIIKYCQFVNYKFAWEMTNIGYRRF